MAPPPFSDLGKQARDIFSKGYHFGILKYDIKAKGPEAVELNTVAVHCQESNKTTGTIEAKKKLQEYGLTLLGKWNTDNVFTAEVANQDQILKGLKVSADWSYALKEGCKGGHVKTAYVHDLCALNGEIECKPGENPYLLTASAVTGTEGILGGVQAKFNVQNSELDSYSIAGGYVTSDFVLHAQYHNSGKINCSGYCKLMPELEGGLDLGFNLESKEPKIECGVKYALDGSSAIRAKFDIANTNLNKIGLGYQHKMSQGVTLFFSAQLNAGSGENGHKIGLAVELEA